MKVTFNPKEFTSTRGNEKPKETSLFKAYLSVSCIYENPDGVFQVIGISPEPIFDKGKYELKTKEIYPQSICNGRNYTVTVIMENSKLTGDIPVRFELEPKHPELGEAVKLNSWERSAGYFKLNFDQAKEPGIYHLSIFIYDNNVTVPDSDQFFELLVHNHEVSGCHLCEVAKLRSGE